MSFTTRTSTLTYVIAIVPAKQPIGEYLWMAAGLLQNVFLNLVGQDMIEQQWSFGRKQECS